MSRAEFMRTPASQPHRDVPPPGDGPEPLRGPGQRRPPGPPSAAARRRTHGGVASHGRPVRQRPIRVTLTVLFLVPLVSLIALWGYAATGTIGSVIGKRNSDTVNKDVGGPAQALLLQLAQERADTFAWQNAHGLIPRASLDTQRARTDAAVSAFNAGAAAAASAGAETTVSQPGIAALSRELGQLGQIRAGVDAGTTQPLAAFQSYNGIVDAFFPFARGSLTSPDGSLPLYQQGEAVIDEAQALELIGREAALVGGALASGDVMTPAEHQLFVQAVDNQRFLEQTAQSPFYWQESADPYPQVFASSTYQSFKAMEDRIAAAGGGTRLPVSPAAWQASVESVLAALNQAETVGRLGVTRGTSHAGNVILLRLFLVGGAGLAAVLVSALLLLRFGNRITRELTRFLMAVRALADERLPAVVSRLRRGEDVDVAAEAPPLALRTRTREVARIADAFGAVQRTAVEAAVGQAELRKGVSNVFRSLARRNQSLLQRQLRMLDAMERGTEDPDALAQLFRLDHLTTRMRRQAEGLIILSGAPPGRGWREPVPVVAGAARRDRRDRGLRPGRPDHQPPRPGARRRGHRRDPPARRAHRKRRAVLSAEHPRPGHRQPGRQRLRSGDRGPRTRHPARDTGHPQRPAGQPARVRPGRQRSARPVRGQPAGCPARDQGNAAQITLRRDLSRRADATRSRAGRRSAKPPVRGRRAGCRRAPRRGPRVSRCGRDRSPARCQARCQQPLTENDWRPGAAPGPA